MEEKFIQEGVNILPVLNRLYRSLFDIRLCRRKYVIRKKIQMLLKVPYLQVYATVVGNYPI